MRIEPVQYEDYVQVMKLLRDSHKESRYSDMPIDCDLAIMRLDKSIEEPNTNIAFKCTVGNDIVGIYIAYISSFDFTNIPIGFEWTFYVSPEFRGTEAAKLLKQAAFDWMDKRKVNRFITAIHHQEDNSNTYTFCEKMGMREIGRIYERMM